MFTNVDWSEWQKRAGVRGIGERVSRCEFHIVHPVSMGYSARAERHPVSKGFWYWTT